MKKDNKNKPCPSQVNSHKPQVNSHPSKLMYERFYRLITRHKKAVAGKLSKRELKQLTKELDDTANYLQSISREYDD